MISRYTIPVTTTGTAGSATGSASAKGRINGFLLGAYFDWHASAPATTDTTLTVGIHSFVVSNTVTDGYYPFRIQARDTAGAAISGVYELPPCDTDTITVSLAQCDALTNAVVAYVDILEIN